VNKKKLGKWKYENSKTGPIHQFVGIRAKIFSLRCDDKKYNKVKTKGIIKAYHERKLRHTFRQSTLQKEENKSQVLADQMHNLKTVLVNKSSLNQNDCKRYILHNGINTLEYGHFSLR